MAVSIVLALSASLLTVYVAPGAYGSGVAEIMAYLNGVNYPKLISRLNLPVKSIGVILAVSSSLAIGKEGPLAHIGSIIAILVIYYIPIPQFKYL